MNTPYLPFLTESLQAASKIAAANFGDIGGTTKPEDNNQVLTATDLEVGKLIVEAVTREFPGHNIIDEEAGVVDRHSDYTWVIDPIDGTSNFAAGVPTYGIMVGLLHHGEPIAGGIALPQFHELYLAERSRGATCNGAPIHVTPETRLLSALVSYMIDGHQENPGQTRTETKLMTEIILNIRNLRTSGSAFDACMVARGGFGATLNQTSKIWDNVAQHILITEAGGRYTGFDGRPLNYRDATARAAENFAYCAGAPALHEALQQIIQANS